MTISDLYIRLFGGRSLQNGSDIDMAEHGRVGGVSTGQAFKYVSDIGASLPTEGNNASLAISNVDTTVASTTVVTKTIGATSYTKTISKNAAGNVVAVSAWS